MNKSSAVFFRVLLGLLHAANTLVLAAPSAPNSEVAAPDSAPALLEPRILGGVKVSYPAQFPFVASVLHDGTHSCSGTILSETTVLTAAHCIHDRLEEKLQVRVGSISTKNGGHVHAVRAMDWHHMWRPDTFDYDIGVLALASPLTLSVTVAAATLVKPGTKHKPGTPLRVLGWGQLSSRAGLASHDALRMATVQVVGPMTCNFGWPVGRVMLTPRMLCAANPGRDACNGDSGGPLVQPGNSVVRGGVSWGSVKCDADPARAGMYTDYANKDIAAWIQSAVKGLERQPLGSEKMVGS